MSPFSWTALSIAFDEDECRRILKNKRATVNEVMLGVQGTNGMKTTSCGRFEM